MHLPPGITRCLKTHDQATQRAAGKASPGGHSAATSRPTETSQASQRYAHGVREKGLTRTAFCSDDWGASPSELPPSRRPSICVPVMRVARSCSWSTSCLAPPHDSVLCRRVNCQIFGNHTNLCCLGPSICVPVMRVGLSCGWPGSCLTPPHESILQSHGLMSVMSTGSSKQPCSRATICERMHHDGPTRTLSLQQEKPGILRSYGACLETLRAYVADLRESYDWTDCRGKDFGSGLGVETCRSTELAYSTATVVGPLS